MEQRTFDWYRARLGKFTASTISDLMTKGRGKDELFGKTALTLINQVAYERMLNPVVVDDDAEDGLFADYLYFTNTESKAMRWGIEQEPVARSLYCIAAHIPTDKVVETGSMTHKQLHMLAASPDGLVDDDGLVEIKCVGSASFMRYLEVTDGDTLKAIEPKYYWQVQCQLACTDRAWCDFVVYNPFVAQPLHIARIDRNAADIALMLERVVLANEMADDIVNKHLNNKQS